MMTQAEKEFFLKYKFTEIEEGKFRSSRSGAFVTKDVGGYFNIYTRTGKWQGYAKNIRTACIYANKI